MSKEEIGTRFHRFLSAKANKHEEKEKAPYLKILDANLIEARDMPEVDYLPAVKRVFQQTIDLNKEIEEVLKEFWAGSWERWRRMSPEKQEETLTEGGF